MNDKYITVYVYTIAQYEQELKSNKDITAIKYFGDTEKLDEYVTKNKNKSLRHTLAYLWRFNKSFFEFSGEKDLKLVEKLPEKADPLCVFFKFLFANMLNITVNGKSSDYYYKKCFEVGPHILNFDEGSLGKYAEYDMLAFGLKYDYSFWCANYIEKNFKYSKYHEYLEIFRKFSHAGCILSSALYIRFMLDEDYAHDINENELYVSALKILNSRYAPDTYDEMLFSSFYYYYPLASYYMHCYEYRIPTLYNVYLNSLNTNLFKFIPETKLVLGICYFSGLGVAQDYKKAFEIFSSNTSERRFVDTYYNFFLGKMYKDGLYVTKNISKGMDLLMDYYPRAALEKYSYWMENKSYDEIIEHFELHRPFNSLFKEDFTEYYSWKNYMAQNVGYIYHVIKADYQKAIEVYNQSVNSGGCMNNLGYLYEYNLHDLENAFKAYQKSAEYKDPSGTWNLAMCYYYGKGTSVNMEEFKKYHELAKALNFPDAINFKI